MCGDWARGTKQRSEPFGAACFERLAGVFASRVALQNNPDIGAEKSEYVHGGNRK